VNQVALVGNITDDPELRYTQSGAALAGFTVAVSHRSKHNGECQDVNDRFFRCTAWRSVAENASRTLRKGMRVFVAGKLVQRSWQDNDGNKRQTVEIQVTHVGPDDGLGVPYAPPLGSYGSRCNRSESLAHRDVATQDPYASGSANVRELSNPVGRAMVGSLASPRLSGSLVCVAPEPQQQPSAINDPPTDAGR
jgi:single stranded DNA-binding protein